MATIFAWLVSYLGFWGPLLTVLFKPILAPIGSDLHQQTELSYTANLSILLLKPFRGFLEFST